MTPMYTPKNGREAHFLLSVYWTERCVLCSRTGTCSGKMVPGIMDGFVAFFNNNNNSTQPSMILTRFSQKDSAGAAKVQK